MKMKKCLCYALSILTVFGTVVGFSACNNQNATEPAEETTAQTETATEEETAIAEEITTVEEKKTEKADENEVVSENTTGVTEKATSSPETTSKKEASTKKSETATRKTEPATQKQDETTVRKQKTKTEKTTEAQTTAKQVEATKKSAETTTRKAEEKTTKKASEATTVKTEEKTTKKSSTDISRMGTSLIDPERAGRYYNEEGKLTTYAKIPEGALYYHYDSNGNLETETKPYSKKQETTTQNKNVCSECGKTNVGKGNHYACASGGCSRWSGDIDCPECGKFVPAWTCHTCKNPTKKTNPDK